MLMMSVTAYRSNAHNIIPMSVVWRPKCGVVCEVWCGVQTKCGVAPSVRSSVRPFRPFRPSPSVSVRARTDMVCTQRSDRHAMHKMSTCVARCAQVCRWPASDYTLDALRLTNGSPLHRYTNPRGRLHQNSHI